MRHCDDRPKALERPGELSKRRKPSRGRLVAPLDRPLVGEPRQMPRRFRLVGRSTGTPSNRGTALGEPITSPNDPRWVLALRTAQRLQGDILTFERRQQLQRVGQLLGLTPFSISLIIAIVQDQARRGYAPEDCPIAGEQQLRMVRLPSTEGRGPKAMRVALAIAGLLAIELLVVKAWLLG